MEKEISLHCNIFPDEILQGIYSLCAKKLNKLKIKINHSHEIKQSVIGDGFNYFFYSV